MPDTPLSRDNVELEFDDRLDVSQLELWDKTQYDSYERMAVARGNAAAEKVYQTTNTELPKLMAKVRWEIIGMPNKAFAEEMGVSPNGYAPMEKDMSPDQAPHRVKYTLAQETWERFGISPGVREQMLELLVPGEDIYSFWKRVGFEVGHAHVEELTPNFYNRLWQQERTGTVQKYLDFYTQLSEIYPELETPRGPQTQDDHREYLEHDIRRERRLSQGEQVWTKARMDQYTDRGIETPLAEFIVALEKDCAVAFEETISIEHMREHYGFTPQMSENLMQFELIDWEIIEDLAAEMFDEKSLRRLKKEWIAAYEKEQKRIGFPEVFVDGMKEQELSAADVGRALDIRPPEERIEGYKANRAHRYRPDANVRGVVFENRSTTLVPVLAAVRIASGFQKATERYILDKYKEERTRFYKRTGAKLEGKGLEMRIARELAGVDMKDLARHFLEDNPKPAVLRAKDINLQKLERNEMPDTWEHCYPEVMEVLNNIAEEKAEAAERKMEELDQIPAELLEWDTMADMASSLVRAYKGSRNVRDVMIETAENDDMWLRDDLIRQIGAGEYSPKLPALRHLATSAGLKKHLPEEVRKDWYDKHPAYLRDREVHPMEDPLARILTTLIDAIEGQHQLHFFEERYIGGDKSHAKDKLFQLQRRSEEQDDDFIEQTLRAAGVKPSDPVWAAALTLQNGETADEALKAAHIVLQKKDLEPHPMNLPGFTQEEIDSVKVKRGRQKKSSRSSKGDKFGGLRL